MTTVSALMMTSKVIIVGLKPFMPGEGADEASNGNCKNKPTSWNRRESGPDRPREGLRMGIRVDRQTAKTNLLNAGG
jgi:hypothetical protein